LSILTREEVSLLEKGKPAPPLGKRRKGCARRSVHVGKKREKRRGVFAWAEKRKGKGKLP